MNIRAKRNQKLYGLRWAVWPAIRGYLDQKATLIFHEVETLTLIDAALDSDFFLRPKRNADGIQAFGQLYRRHPKETLELLQVIRDELNDNAFQSKIIRRYLATHKTDTITNDRIAKHLTATAGAGTITPDSVETERRHFLSWLARQEQFQSPARQFIAKYGFTYPKK